MNNDIVFKVFSELDVKLQEKVSDFRNRYKRNEPSRSNGDQVVHQDKFCSDSDIFKWIFALSGEDIVGMVAAFKRNITYQGEELVLGGVGKMRVLEEYQRRGVASNIMEIVMGELNNELVDVALLCTNTNSFLVNFYEKYGFKLLGKSYRYTGKSGKDYMESEGMIAPINSVSKYNKILASENVLDIGSGNW